MKIICVDNYDRDSRSHKLICENISDYFGKLIVDFLNSREHKESEDFFRLVNDDYKLYKFEP